MASLERRHRSEELMCPCSRPIMALPQTSRSNTSNLPMVRRRLRERKTIWRRARAVPSDRALAAFDRSRTASQTILADQATDQSEPLLDCDPIALQDLASAAERLLAGKSFSCVALRSTGQRIGSIRATGLWQAARHRHAAGGRPPPPGGNAAPAPCRNRSRDSATSMG